MPLSENGWRNLSFIRFVRVITPDLPFCGAPRRLPNQRRQDDSAQDQKGERPKGIVDRRIHRRTVHPYCANR